MVDLNLRLVVSDLARVDSEIHSSSEAKSELRVTQSHTRVTREKILSHKKYTEIFLSHTNSVRVRVSHKKSQKVTRESTKSHRKNPKINLIDRKRDD